MKNLFKTGHKVLTVHFSDKKGSEYKLRYLLYDHSPGQKFEKLTEETFRQKLPIQQGGVFFGNGFNKRQEVIELINTQIDFHNNYCEGLGLKDFTFPVKTDHPLTQERLTLLHEYFENYAEHSHFVNNPKTKVNLQEINLSIHLLESCLDVTSTSSHVEILPSSSIKGEFDDEDYKYFTPDSVWGEVVLTYGITGVPTISSYYSKSKPTPQNCVSNGMFLAFFNDHVFDQHNQLEEWLKPFGLDPKDPKSAVGYIPLGILENIGDLDREHVLSQIAKHRHVSSYSITDSHDSAVHEVTTEEKKLATTDAECRWPYDPEIFYHTDLCPYLDLNVTFNAEVLFEEAFKARDYFVTHREYDQTSKELQGKWKSLALHGLDGDYTKTMYHTSYGIEGKATYKKTAFAELCPETMKFLETITDVSQCERVRFMLLEPGASIKTHRDSHTRDVSFAVNISLNMPDGCEFFAQLNPDGSENPYTVKIPFSDKGSVVLFNNAKYHKVVNNSDKPRIHIIFHGPIKFSDEKLIELARKQNGISTRKELMQTLIKKKAFLGEELKKTQSLLGDWVSSGLAYDTLPENFSLCVYEHGQYHASASQIDYLTLRTLPTLFPLKVHTIKENEWDNYLTQSFQEGKDFAVLMAAGIFVKNLNVFIESLVEECFRLKNSGGAILGHIMDFNNNEMLPYLHEQFVIVNLKVWDKLGRIPLGPLFQTDRETISNIVASEEKIHGDYTPVRLESGEGKREGKIAWGSLLIKQSLLNNIPVLNLETSLRDVKSYAYPRDEALEPKAKIEENVTDKLNFSSKEVYYFNNEPLEVLAVEKLNPNKLISVSAGFKPFQIIKQYKMSEGSEIHFVDFSERALNYIQSVTKEKNYDGLCFNIKKQITNDPLKKYDPNITESLLASTVRESFSDNPAVLMRSIKVAENATFEKNNIVLNPEAIAKYLKPKDTFVIWVSNSFYNNQLYFLLTPDAADAQFEKLAKEVGKATNLRVFRFGKSQTCVFGKGLDFIRGILTDGAPKVLPMNIESWNEL